MNHGCPARLPPAFNYIIVEWDAGRWWQLSQTIGAKASDWGGFQEFYGCDFLEAPTGPELMANAQRYPIWLGRDSLSHN